MKAPSFKGYRPSSPASSRAKQANPPRDTRPERLLRRTLWKLGLRFRTHASDLPGCPDIVVRRVKIAVFCDGDFWHGRRWPALRRALQRRANPSYWVAKIGSNRLRDARSRRRLRRLGWRVIGLWESDIQRDPKGAALAVKAEVDSRLKKVAKGSDAQRRTTPRRGSTA